jgi:hypothetical protein
LILVVIAVIQTSPYSHAAAVGAEAFFQPHHAATEQGTGTDDWPTYHRDMLRSGYDPEFPTFTSVSLHWKSATLDGDVYAEPLVVGTDVIVTTEQNSLYELDATTGNILWHDNFGTPVTSGLYCSGDIDPSGITSTPVVDTTTGTIFIVAFLQGPPLHHQLFAVDLNTGAVEFNVGVDPSSSSFPVNAQQQRAALALANGYVYIPYGGLYGDCGPYHGWLTAINENGQGSLITYQVPTGREGAIWGGGDGPVVDQSGDLLVATGNSDATSTFDYGDAVLKLSPATSPPITLLDYFAPSNWAALNSGDVDLGSTEPVTLSSNYLFQIGKEGVGYILNANSLGRIGGQVYSSQVCTEGGGAYGGLAYLSPYLIVPCDNGLVALDVNLSSPSFTVAWTGPNYLTGPPIIAGNAVWDVDAGNGLIYAFSLTNGQTLFSASIGSLPTHFNSLTAAYGQIFVTASQQVIAYGVAPTIALSPNSGPVGTSTTLSGSGFAAGDTGTCTLSSSPSALISNPTCTISGGTASGSFTVANVALGPYTVTVTGSTGDMASSTFTVTPSQVTMKVSYSVAGGGSGYSAPVFHYLLNGVSTTLTLTTTPKSVLVDAGKSWSVTPNPLTGSGSSQRWYSSQPLTGTASAETIVFTFQHQYYLTINASGPGTVTPSSGWHNSGVKITITASAKSGHKFKSWTGSGTGSYTGTSKTHTITINSAITETATFI